MLHGQRVVWLVSGKYGIVTAYSPETRTVDVTFDDGGTRGRLPMAEVVVYDGPVPAVEPDPGDRILPPGIEPREGFGRL